MKISMEILYRECLKWHPNMKSRKSTAQMKYMGIAAVSQSSKPTQGYLLMGKAEQFADIILEDAGIICIGEIPDSIKVGNDIMWFPGECDFEELYREILAVFTLFEEWNLKMQQAIMKEESLQKIAEISEPVFKNPILIHNFNFNVLAYTQADYGLQLWRMDTDNRPVMTMEIINEFKVDKEYQSTLNVCGPAIFSDAMFGYPVLYINLRVENQYFGRICISQLNRTIAECDKQLLVYMADFVLHSFRLGYYMLSEKPQYLKNTLMNLIDGDTIEKQQLQSVLKNSGWSLKDSFYCACLFTDSRDIQINTIKTACQSLELHFPKTCIFNYYDNIVIVVNTALNYQSIHEFSSELGVFLREGLFKVGISSLGKDFLRLRHYYQQSVAAYEIGCKKDSSFWHFEFDEYVLPYIFSQATQIIPKDLVSSQELRALRDYDQLHQTEFLLTLKKYLESNMNLTRTSECLNIHRTTLLYRLERIENLININLDDAKQRFFLLWSYYLWE